MDKKDLDEYGLAVLGQETGKLNWVAQGMRTEPCCGVAELSEQLRSASMMWMSTTMDMRKTEQRGLTIVTDSNNLIESLAVQENRH